jgi:hypothetical protein
MQLLKVWCEGPTDVPVFKALLEQIPDVPKVLFDFVGGWGNLVNKDPHNFEHGCKEAFIVMDGDLGRRLGRKDRPLTKQAKEQEKRLVGFPVELHVLKRYGIENYFPKAILEAVIGRDLTPFFPIPDHVAVMEYLKNSGGQTRWQAIQRFLVSRLHLRIKLSGTSLYSKSANEKVAQSLVFDRDMLGTDLGVIISRIAERANSLANS